MAANASSAKPKDLSSRSVSVLFFMCRGERKQQDKQQQQKLNNIDKSQDVKTHLSHKLPSLLILGQVAACSDVSSLVLGGSGRSRNRGLRPTTCWT